MKTVHRHPMKTAALSRMREWIAVLEPRREMAGLAQGS
jgi:hypothetical protein